MRDRVHIVGVLDSGPDSLAPPAMALVEGAELLIGGRRLLGMFPRSQAEKVPMGANLAQVAQLIEANVGKRTTVVLASGDPVFYGIGRYLVNKLGKERVEIHPNVSAMQLAFARIKESWEDAALASVHGRGLQGVVSLVARNIKVGLFTDPENNPAAIARTLLHAGIRGCRAYVCENLGGAGERIIQTDLEGLARTEVGPLNVLILIRQDPVSVAGRPWTLGMPESMFLQRKPEAGLITKAEVRVISLSKMALRPDSVVWDVGAGSGSVAIEAAMLAPRGMVFAVEKNAEDVENIIKPNIASFGVTNVVPVVGLAPAALETLPDPDAVFVGGSGGRMAQILELAARRLSAEGRIVVNAATIENLHEAVEGLKANGLAVDVAMVNVARGKGVIGLTRFDALDPVFVVWGEKLQGQVAGGPQ